MFFIFEITTVCNLNCKYCYNIWHENQNYKKGQMKFETFRKIIKKLKKDGFDLKTISLAGGEPLLNEDIFEMAEYAMKKNIKVIICSNGVLLSDEIIKKFLKIKVRNFIVSLPTLSKENFGQICDNNENKLALIKQGILKLRRKNCNLAIAFTLTALNIFDVKNLVKFIQVAGISELQINRFCPGGRGIEFCQDLNVSNNDFNNFLINLDSLVINNLNVIINAGCEPCLFDYDQFVNLKFGRCECGLKKWVVDFQGNLRICEQDNHIVGNILESGFCDLVEDDYVNLFNEKNLKSECGECDKFDICRGGCRFSGSLLE